MIPPIGALDSRSIGHEGLPMRKSIRCKHFLPAALVEKPSTWLQNEKTSLIPRHTGLIAVRHWAAKADLSRQPWRSGRQPEQAPKIL